MKFLLISVFLSTSLAATAQTSTYSSVMSQINDDAKTLSIRINGDQNGRPIQYNRTFNVAGLNKSQRDALKNRVLDSLGLSEPPKPPTPPSPTGLPRPPAPVDPADIGNGESNVTFTCASCTGKNKLLVSGNDFSMTREYDTSKDKDPAFPFNLSLIPGEYRLMYWQNNVLQIQSTFTVKEDEKSTVLVK